MKIAFKTIGRASVGRSKPALALSLALATLALAGCKHDDGAQVAGWTLVDPTQRHPILVSQQPAHLNLDVARGSQGLTPSQRADVSEFASHYRAGDAGNSRLIIAAPSGSANEVAAMSAVQDVRELLVSSGFSESSIAVEAYSDEHSGTPPIRISYMRYVAEGPSCGHTFTNMATDAQNTGSPNHGCANQHNLAAMISNPADLLGPRTEGSRYGERRDDVMNKYAKGKVTGAEKSEDERVRVKGAN